MVWHHRFISLLLLLVAPLARAEDEDAPEVPAAPRPAAPLISKPERPFKIPDGEAKKGWELLLKNDFAGAEAALREALAKNPKNLEVLEGLRASLISRGDYKGAQQVNLDMLIAAPNSQEGAGLAAIFASRAMDGLAYSESRAAVLDAFTKYAAIASPRGAAMIRDQIASLHMRADKPDEAKKALEGLGYIDKWQFVAGPFGSKDKNDPFERRYAPERALKSLEFKDEAGKPVVVRKDVEAPHRAANLYTIFQGATGVFYAFANLESDSDQDVVFGVSAPSPYRVFLRGMPIAQAPGEEQFARQGGDLIRTRLIKGANPVLVKLASAGSLVVRVTAVDQSPLKDVRTRPLGAEALAAHEVSPLRGFVLGQKVPGMMGEHFLKRVHAELGKPDFIIKEPRAIEPGALPLADVVDSGLLSLAEASWIDFALTRENDPRARLNLARIIAGSAPDAVGPLDIAAHILSSAGATMGNTEAREVEDARRLREHALKILPTSHQHLIALYFFFNGHNLADQAFENIKACAAAHPQSSFALAELSRVYQSKQFMVEAEQCLEKAAALDDVYLTRLVQFHEHNGNRVRARELRKKQIELGQLDADAQFEIALAQGNLDEAAALLAQQEKAYPDRADEFTGRRIRLLIEKGDLPAAFALQKKQYDALPESENDIRRRPLAALVDLAIRMSKDDEAKELLRKHLAENPGDYELRKRLRELEGDTQARWWEAYDVKVADIDTSQFTAEKYKNSNHAWIVDFMVTRILPDLSRESYVHIAQKVLNVKGVGELSEVLVAAQRNEIVFIRTLNPDGSSFQPQNVHNFDLAQTASLYKVGPGSILEHAYLEHADADKDEPWFNMGFNFNAIDAPRAVSQWTVLIADEAKKKLDIRKICPEMIEEKLLPGPAGYTVYQWKNKQVEGVKFEPLMPGERDQETIPLVLIETPDQPYRSSRWLARRERDFIPPEAADEAQRICNAVRDEDELLRFRALTAWVRDNIAVGQDSRTLDDVWFSRTGSTAQMTTLLREMAQSAGLKCRTAFTNGSYMPGRVWKSKNAKHKWDPDELANFSSGFTLVLERETGRDVWVQFVGNSPKFYDPFQFNANQPGALAITYGEDAARIKRVHAEELGLSQFSHRMEVALDKEGGAAVAGTLQVFGNLAGYYREAMSDPRQTQRIKDSVPRNSWPKIQNTKVESLNDETPGQPLIFKYSGSVKRMAACEAEGACVLPPFLGPARLLNLRGPLDRQHDLLLKSEASDLDHTITYTAPEGCAWVQVPDDLFVTTEFGFFLADYNVRGRTLTCTRSYLMPAQRVLPENYAKLQEFLNAISDDQQQRIGYAPLKSESFGVAPVPVFTGGYSGIGGEKQSAKPAAPAQP